MELYLRLPQGYLAFRRPYFHDLVRCLNKKADAAGKLLDLMSTGSNFAFAGVDVKKVPRGWMWISPRRSDFGVPGQILKMSPDTFQLMRSELLNIYSYKLERERLWRTPEPMKRAHYHWKRFSYRKAFDWAMRSFISVTIVIHFIYISRPRLQLYSSLLCRRRLSRGRQSHGMKTVSNHFLKCQEQLLELIEEPG